MTAVSETRPGTATTGPRPRTIPSRIRDWAHTRPDDVAMREKRYGLWQDITWAEYWEQAQLVAHGLVALGVGLGDRVAVHAENRREWLYVDVGTVACGGITVGLYPTNPAAEVAYQLADCGARVLVAEDQEQVDKALEVVHELPDLAWIVYVDPRGVREYDHPKLLSWQDFLARGAEHRAANPELLPDRADRVAADDVVTLIYTSGTTGQPKGAMLTVANVEFAIATLAVTGGFYDPPANPDDVSLSYLPLCHVAERLATEWLHAEAGMLVHFAESIDTVQANLVEVQPTLFLAVPRIWEKIHAGIHIKLASASLLKRLNGRFWLKVAARIGDEVAARQGRHTWWTRLLYWLGYPFLFRALRRQVGLRHCRAAVSGAAPVSPDVLKFFLGLGLVVRELYGMTENSGVATSNFPGRVRLGSVGEPHPGTELVLDEHTGEILNRHPGVFAGYWNLSAQTAETIDADGWLHTGDVGEWVDGTHIRIVDRIKDIIVTAGGKNISPSLIENALKASPYIKEAVVVGDRRPYVTALIGIELDTVADWATRRGIPYTTYRDLSEKPEVLGLVREIVLQVNGQFARVEQIRKFRTMPKELDQDAGELTATQKVKRAALHRLFGELIDDMYGDTERCAGGGESGVHGPAPVRGAPDRDRLDISTETTPGGTAWSS